MKTSQKQISKNGEEKLTSSQGDSLSAFLCRRSEKGTDDNRYLWPQMLRAIQEIQPTWVIGENVAGILTMVQPGEEAEVANGCSIFEEDNRKRVLLRQEYVVETICQDLEREGYSIQPILIPACAVGAPHRRDRVWFVAHRTNAGIEDVRRAWENTILSDGTAPNPDIYGRRFGKGEQKPDSRSEGKTDNSTGCKMGLLPSPVASDAAAGAIMGGTMCLQQPGTEL